MSDLNQAAQDFAVAKANLKIAREKVTTAQNGLIEAEAEYEVMQRAEKDAQKKLLASAAPTDQEESFAVEGKQLNEM